MAKKNKKPKRKFNPSSSKEPRTAQKDQLMFRWRTDYADLSSEEWGWGRVDISQFFGNIVRRLHNIEDSKWAELIGTDMVHFTEPFKIVRKAQRRLELLANGSTIPEDLIKTDLASIHLAGQPVIWGYKVGRLFYLLWFDPKHSVYPVPKKYT